MISRKDLHTIACLLEDNAKLLRESCLGPANRKPPYDWEDEYEARDEHDKCCRMALVVRAEMDTLDKARKAKL